MLKFLTILALLASQTAFGLGFTNQNFATQAQIISAGGSPSNLLNDSKLYVGATGGPMSDAILGGSVFNTSAVSLHAQWTTPLTPPAPLHNYLYFKADDKLYAENSLGVETLVGPGSGSASVIGTPSTFAGFDGLGGLYTVPGWTITAQNGSYSLHTLNAQPTLTEKLYAFEAEVNPALGTTDYNANTHSFDTHFDRTGSNTDMLGQLNVVQLNGTHEGRGRLGGMSIIGSSSFLGGTGFGSQATNAFATHITTVADGFVVDNYDAFSHQVNVQSLGGVGAYRGIRQAYNGSVIGNFNGEQVSQGGGSVFGGYTGYSSNVSDDVYSDAVGYEHVITGTSFQNRRAFSATQNGNTLGNAYALVETVLGDVTGNKQVVNGTMTGSVFGGYGVVSGTLDGDATNGFAAFTMSHLGTHSVVGTGEVLRGNYSNGQYDGKTLITGIMGNGSTIGGGRIIEASWGGGNYNNRITFNIDGGSGNIATNEIGMQLGATSGSSQGFQGVHISGNNTTILGGNQFVGLAVDGGATVLGTVNAINVNLSGYSSPNQKIGLSIQDGAIQAQGVYDTSINSQTPFFGAQHSLSGNFTVAAGFPMTNSAFLGVNQATNAFFNDNMGPDPFGGLLGYTYVGYFGGLRVAAGKSVDHINMAIAAASNDAGSGTVNDMNMYATGGLISAGGTVTASTLSHFNVLPIGCQNVTGDCYGVRVQPTTAKNYLGGSTVMGGAYTNPLYALNVNGDALVRSALLLEDPGVGTSTVSVVAPTLVGPSWALTLPVDAGLPGQVLGTDGTGVTSWVNGPASSTMSPEVFRQNGGVTYENDIDGTHLAESALLLQRVVVCLSDSGVSGSTLARINYGPALASQTFASVVANGTSACATTVPSPAVNLAPNDFYNVDIIAVPSGTPRNVSVKLVF